MASKRAMFTFLSFLFLLFLPNFAFSETKTFIKEYTYQASDEDSKNSSRTTALREVKRLILEEMGTYLESITEVKDFQLTKDEITTLTAGIVQTELLEEKWNTENMKYWLKAKVTADSSEVIKSIDALRKDRGKVKELEGTRRKSEELLKENSRLRKELETAKGEKKVEMSNTYKRNIASLNADEWFERGYAYNASGNYRDAFDAFSKAIELNPRFAEAYSNRGVSNYSLGNYQQAISDQGKAIELNPQFAAAYSNRGQTYSIIGNCQQALRDNDKAIELDPKIPLAYVNRGNSYTCLGNFKRALEDCDKAIELDPNTANAYAGRGHSYLMLGNLQKALMDCNKAVELDPKLAVAYEIRGDVHTSIKIL